MFTLGFGKFGSFGFLWFIFQAFFIWKNVNESKPLLTKAVRVWQERSMCFSCHTHTRARAGRSEGHVVWQRSLSLVDSPSTEHVCTWNHTSVQVCAKSYWMCSCFVLQIINYLQIIWYEYNKRQFYAKVDFVFIREVAFALGWDCTGIAFRKIIDQNIEKSLWISLINWSKDCPDTFWLSSLFELWTFVSNRLDMLMWLIIIRACPDSGLF